jgi:hypothetical protein
MNSRTTTNLQSEMKVLKWHKLANESALHAAILKNKMLKRVEKAMPRIQFELSLLILAND